MRRARSVRHPRSAVLVVGAALCALLLTACGSSTPNAPSTSAPAATPSAATTAATTAPASPSGVSGGTVTLVGSIEAGVESGCVVLVGPDGAVLANLIDLDSSAAPLGSSVEITGQFQEDLMTTCQQGKPFTITTLEVG